MNKITEQASHYHQLENMSVGEILKNINQEDAKVALAVANVLPKVEGLSLIHISEPTRPY